MIALFEIADLRQTFSNMILTLSADKVIFICEQAMRILRRETTYRHREGQLLDKRQAD
jgi:hypothetical protein